MLRTVCLSVVVLLASPAGAAPPAPRAAGTEHVARVYEILASQAGSVGGRRHRVELLVELGPDAIPSMCAVLTGAAPPPEPEGSEQGLAQLSPGQQTNEVLLEALRQMPPKPVLDFLDSLAEAELPVGYRLVAMRILGGTGDRRAVGTWVRLLERLEPVHLMRAYVQAPAEAALADVLRADSFAYRDLAESVDRIPPAMYPLIARAVGQAGRADGLDVLERLMGRDEELDLVVLDQVAEIGNGAPLWRLHHLVDAVRRHLDDDDWRMRRGAAVALARLHDVDSFPRLLELLEDDYRRVRQGALWGVQEMSEMRWSAEEVDRWQAWFDAQYTWWQANRDRLEEELRSRDPGHVLAAIKVLSERRLFRHEVAEMIATVVDHPRASIARTACTSLERLGSRRVVPPLVAALERSDESVREAATQALCTLTGADLPADAEAWADYLR